MNFGKNPKHDFPKIHPFWWGQASLTSRYKPLPTVHYLELGCSRHLPWPSKCPLDLRKSLGDRGCTTQFQMHPFSPQ